MFQIENSIPFLNGTLIQGRFLTQHPSLMEGEQLIAEKGKERIGIVRIVKILGANFSHQPTNPKYHISIAFEGHYEALIGATIRKITTG